MKFYTIEVDEKVWNYLKKNAEPFKDTPNSVLNRLIFGRGTKPASKISAPPRPYQKQTPKVEIEPEKELSVDGIKLELDNNNDSNDILEKFSLNPSPPPDNDIHNLQIELDQQFESNENVDDLSLHSVSSFKPDKDIDDFINELERSNASASLKDEFSDLLKEIPNQEGEWTEISIQPSRDADTGGQPPTIKPVLKGPDRQIKTQLDKKQEKPPEKKKPKLISFEDRLVYSLGERLKNQWGEFRQEGVGLLIFANKTVLCKFSKYDEENVRWLWGVSQADRYAWGPQNWLALILEDEDHSSYSFLLFNSQESGVLFDQCKQTTGDKYITMLIDDAYDSLRIQEWRHLDLRNRKKTLPLYNPDDE